MRLLDNCIRTLMLLGMVCGISLWGKLSVQILSCQQRWPWNGLVDIRYRVDCDEKNLDGTPMHVNVSFSGYDRDLDRTIEMKSFSGEGAGKTVTAGDTCSIVWDAQKDYPNLHSSDFKVKAYATTDPKPFSGKYLVIDLSGGPKAQFYPHRYSDTGPDVSSDACRTTELWLRQIPAGTFMMGSPKDETGHRDTEDCHQVTLTKSYYMGVFEMTQKQWELVMGNNPSRYKGNDRPVEQVSYEDIRGRSSAAGASWPILEHMVDAESFMGKLQNKTGLIVDLPTEAQWEYACRAGTTTALNSGKNLTKADGKCPNMDLLGRYYYNLDDAKGGYLQHTRVGSYLPNSWGLYDMHGNVVEWCLDWYQEKLGSIAVTEPVGPAYGQYRLLRGGYWRNVATDCRSSARRLGDQHTWYSEYGFRVACSKTTPDPKKYLVVDLSGGPDAQSYPHRYSETGPDVGGDKCRTTELWLRKIPAGTFMMGDSKTLEYSNGQQDYHRVTLTKSFYLGVFEVTQRQWELVMGDNPSYYKGECRPVEQISYENIRGTGTKLGAGWPTYGHRVDADSFLGKLQAKAGLVLDTPTEAQWEYACRAGTTTELNSGKNLSREYGRCSNLDKLGRYQYNLNDGKGDYLQHTRVGSYLPNAWGLYDMHGNVREWCLDWSQSHSGASAVTDPKGPDKGEYRIQRGGGYDARDGIRGCRSAARGNANPYDKSFDCGVRLAYYDVPIKPVPVARPNTGKYLVIDLSGGMHTLTYPYRYSETDPDITDNTCRTTELWLRQIPAGTFMMGNPRNGSGDTTDEEFHQVTLTKPFYIGIFEVTQMQWLLVMGKYSAYHQGSDRPVEQISYGSIRGTKATAGAGWPTYGHKVDADSFLGKLQTMTGLLLDLPTEAQWEYACRAGTTTDLNSGKDLSAYYSRCSNLDQLGRYYCNQHDGKVLRYYQHTRVGSYLPNSWGLYDMHGNVEEWCLDWYQGKLGMSAVTDPVGPANGSSRVRRGGDWKDKPLSCRSFYRTWDNPFNGHDYCGFRVACP